VIQNLSSKSPKEPVDCSRRYTHSLSKIENIKLQGLFSDLANRSYWWLLRNNPRMSQYEVDLAHLHPLTFLERSILDPYRREELVKIKDRGALIWDSFTKNLAGKLEQEDIKGNLKPYLTEFAKTLKLPKKDLLLHIQNKDLEKLITQAIGKESQIVPKNDLYQVFEKFV